MRLESLKVKYLQQPTKINACRLRFPIPGEQQRNSCAAAETYSGNDPICGNTVGIIPVSLIKFMLLLAIGMPVVAVEVWFHASKAGEMCTYTLKGKTSYKFNCRWMIDGSTKKTIFVDNHETGDRYEVGQYDFMIGPTSNCITRYAVAICTKKWW